MQIREANSGDIKAILKLLSQVLEIHAAIRPDIFKSGTTKYDKEKLDAILCDKNRPIYVAAEGENILGYAFCILKDTDFKTTMYKRKTLFIDDLCVDENARGKGIGKALFDYVKCKASELGCDEITLNVWQGNDAAREFYEKMGMRVKETVMEIKL